MKYQFVYIREEWSSLTWKLMDSKVAPSCWLVHDLMIWNQSTEVHGEHLSQYFMSLTCFVVTAAAKATRRAVGKKIPWESSQRSIWFITVLVIHCDKRLATCMMFLNVHSWSNARFRKVHWIPKSGQRPTVGIVRHRWTQCSAPTSSGLVVPTVVLPWEAPTGWWSHHHMPQGTLSSAKARDHRIWFSC